MVLKALYYVSTAIIVLAFLFNSAITDTTLGLLIFLSIIGYIVMGALALYGDSDDQ